MNFPEVLQPCYANCIEDASSAKSFLVSTYKRYLIQFFLEEYWRGRCLCNRTGLICALGLVAVPC